MIICISSLSQIIPILVIRLSELRYLESGFYGVVHTCRSFIRSFVHSSIRSLVHSFMHSNPAMRGNGNKPCAQRYPAYACVQFDRLGVPPVFAPRRPVGVPPQCLLPRIIIEPELQMNLGAASPGFWTLICFADRVSDRDRTDRPAVSAN